MVGEVSTDEIKLPGDLVFYERSYSHCNQGTKGSRLSIDEDQTDRADAGFETLIILVALTLVSIWKLKRK